MGLTEISNDLGNFSSLTTLALLLQHCMLFLFIVRSFWSIPATTLRSMHTFHGAGKKARKSLTKLQERRRQSRQGVSSSTVKGEERGGSDCMAADGGELRRRGHG